MNWTKLFEFLYDNGFRYVARDCYHPRSAIAFVNEPTHSEQQFDDMYWDPQEKVFIIDLNAGRDTFPVELGKCKKIEELFEHDKVDVVNHPKHYKLPSGRESIEVMKEVLTDEEYRGWCKGNALKYIFREGKKDDAVQDIKKAGKFLEFLMEEK